MEPTIQVNAWAILACVVVAMPVGFVWFGPLFGKPWARHMGLPDMPQPAGGAMAKSMALYALGSLLIAFVLVHSLEIWRASTWGLAPDLPSYTYAWNSAFFTWLGFFLPIQIGRVAWEQKGWGLVAINAGFDFVRLMLFAFILAYWR
jgi:hypothetical protein